MNPEQYRRVAELFYQVMERPEPERQRFAEELCGSDHETRSFLLKLIRSAAPSRLTTDTPIQQFEDDDGYSPSFLPNEILLDRFRIVRFLGRGGMGEVYEADDAETGRVALKTIRPEIAGESHILERFRHEVQCARKVTGPHVCRIHEFFTLPAANGRPATAFLTMEFLEGITLADRIDSGVPLSIQEAEKVALEICRGLQTIHDVDIVHRDLKTRNIMLALRKRGAEAVLMDFGLARETSPVALAAAPGGSGSTVPGTIVGTPEYMAPEQFQAGKLTPATDIYALGVVLYEMATGKLPFQAPTPVAAAVQRAKPLKPVSSFRKDLPHRWETTIERCLRYAPEERFQSAEEVARVLQQKWQPGTLLITRRGWIPAAVGGAAITAMALLSEEPLQRMLHPVPKPRRVALIAGAAQGASPEDVSLLSSVVDSVAYALTRAEQVERDLFVLPPRAARQQKAVTAPEIVGLFGVNLLLRITASWTSNAFHAGIELVRASNNSRIRHTTLVCEAATLYRLPALMAREASHILGLAENIDDSQPSAPKTTNPEAYAAYERARGLLALNGFPNIDKAIAELQKAVDLDPQFAEAWAALGQAYVSRYTVTRDASALEIAERDVDRAVSLSPGLPNADTVRASIDLARGNYERAVRELQGAARLDPENSDVLLTLANTYGTWGKLDQADRVFEKLLQMYPNDWIPLNDWGSLYYQRSNYARAAQLFRQATLVNPQAALPWRNLGAVYLVTEHMDEALRALDQSIALLPSGEAYANRGTALFWLGKYHEAAKAYKLAVDLNPNRYVLWRNLGDAYQQLGETSAGREAWQKARPTRAGCPRRELDKQERPSELCGV